MIFREEYSTIVKLSTHHNQSLENGVTRRGELVHVGQEDVEGEGKSHNKDKENHQHFNKSIQDIMENGDVFSNPRKLPAQSSPQ